MGRIVTGFWDCPYCGTKGISGADKSCKGCGRPRGKETVFYMSKQSRVLSEQEAENVCKEADWLCDYCGCYNSACDTHCCRCGASRSDSTQDYFSVRKAASTQQQKDGTSVKSVATAIKQPAASEKKKKKGGFLKSILLTVGLIILAAVSTPKEKIIKARVQSFSWERSIQIEELKSFEEDGWSLPAQARLQYEEEAIKEYETVVDHYETKTRTVSEQVFDHYETKTRTHTEDVFDHYETVTDTVTQEVLDHYETVVIGYNDLGNGYFEEITAEEPVYRWEEVEYSYQTPVYRTETFEETYQEPVYRTQTRQEDYEEPVYRKDPVWATKYYYEIDRWIPVRTVETSGEGKEPIWGEYSIKKNEREADREENYSIKFKQRGKKKYWTVQTDYTTWEKLKKGNTVKLAVNGSRARIYE